MVVVACLVCSSVLLDPAQKQGRGKGVFPEPQSASKEGSVILGNAEDRSIELAVHLKSAGKTFVEYGPEGKGLSLKSEPTQIEAGMPVFIKLTGLKPDSSYSYRLVVNGNPWPTKSFSTQKASGKPFTFFVQGDSHPERVPKMNVPSIYERTLLTANSYKPDLFICLGDDFSVDTLRERTPETVEGVYKKQVPYLGLVGSSTPIYLVNGNHEQAAKANLDGTATSLGVLVQNSRNRNFAQPAPDGFYSGNVDQVPHIGHLRNYYALTWEDALFVTIDPYWHSDKAVDNEVAEGPGEKKKGKGNRNFWDITLGETQYRWLSKTLTESKSKYKFVFAHHVHGTGRGMIEQAPFFEWGGKDKNGNYAFDRYRPNWGLPIHQLFVKSGVSVFFQGHDHIFCRQDLDGVVYQSCPCPADPTNSLINGEAYRSGDKVPGAGLVKVSVGSQKAKVEYIRAFEPAAEADGHKHGEVAFSYDVAPKGGK